MVRAALPCLSVLLLVLGGCSSGARSDGKPTDQQVYDAHMVGVHLDEKLERLRALPAAERYAAQQAVGTEIAAALEKVGGTRTENRLVYYLACWQAEFRRLDGTAPVEALLDRLARLPDPAFKGFGDELRVQLRLRQGRLAEARTMAQSLAERIPELSGILQLVRLHEQVGRPAPRTEGRDLIAGSNGDPAKREEPWQVWLFVGAVDDVIEVFVARHLAAARAGDLAGKVRVVVVTADASPLVTGRLTALPGSDRLDVLWANPNRGGDAEVWRKAWSLPPQPVAVLLGAGPQRAVMAVDLTPEELAPTVAGRRPK